MKLDRSARALATVLALMVAAPAAAQSGDAADHEFRVNTTSPTKQRETAVAFSPDGGFVVVWRDLRAGLTARFFPAGGRPSDDVVLVENLIFENNPGRGTIFSRLHPQPVFLDDGSLLLFWTEEKGFLRAAVFHYEYDILEQDIFAQRFNAQGRPIARRFRVNRVQAGLQRHPSVAVGRDGSFLIAWDASDGVSGVAAGEGVFVRAFDPRGLTTAGEVKLDEGLGVAARGPALAAGRDGGFLAVWEAEGDGTDGTDVYARLLGADGRAVGPQFRLHGATAGDQRTPSVAGGTDGNYLAAWYSPLDVSVFPHKYRIFGQAVGADGALLGPTLTLTESEEHRAHALPRIVASPRGEYLLGWLMWMSDFQTAVLGVRLDLLGNPTGEPFRISEHQPSTRSLGMAAGPRGDFMVTWEGFTDDRTLNVAARRVSGSEPQQPLAMPAAMIGTATVIGP